MKCAQLKKLNRYADNELTACDRSAFELHLKSCPACSGELKNILNIRQSLSANKVRTNPEFFWQQLKARIEKVDHNKAPEAVIELGGWSRRLIPVPVALGLIAIAILNMIPENSNPVDEYIFGNGNASVIELIDQAGNQTMIGG